MATKRTTRKHATKRSHTAISKTAKKHIDAIARNAEALKKIAHKPRKK